MTRTLHVLRRVILQALQPLSLISWGQLEICTASNHEEALTYAVNFQACLVAAKRLFKVFHASKKRWICSKSCVQLYD